VRALLADPGDCPEVTEIKRLDIKPRIAAHVKDESDVHVDLSQPELPALPVEVRDETPKLPPIYKIGLGGYSAEFIYSSEVVFVETNGTSWLNANESDPTTCPEVITNDRQFEELGAACKVSEDSDIHEECSQCELPTRIAFEDETARTLTTEIRRSCAFENPPFVIDNMAT
jgi:hypothetical protein